MAASSTRSPRFRDILLGVAAVVVLLVVFINLGAVIKVIGAGLLVLPSALGIVQRVGADEVSAYNLRHSPTLVGISQPGRYAVYAYDYDLLTTADLLSEAKAAPWISLKSQVTGERVQVDFVQRSLKPYDTHLAKGRPALSFTITQPGVYVMNHPSRIATISIVRDYVTGNERTLTLVMLAQVAVIAAPPLFLFARRSLRRREAHKAAQRRKREESDAFWREHAQTGRRWRPPE